MAEDSSGAVNGAVAGGETSAKPTVMGIPLARWAVIAVSAIVVCYTAGSYSIKLYHDWLSSHIDETSYANAITQEIKAHENDKSGRQAVLFEDTSGQTIATYFSDGCIAVARPGPKLAYMTQPQSIVEWSLAPSRRPKATPPKPTPFWNTKVHTSVPKNPDEALGSTAATPFGDLDREDDVLGQYGSAQSKNMAFQSVQAGVLDGPQLHPVQGSCVNPHAGPFNNWYGPANGCWAPFWRQWRDGCTHYQMYNTCNGQWDPQIHWTFCAVQHFY
jgi:hypothetical protein